MSAYALVVDPRRLLIFREVARAGSISAAARTLGWTQPAVSQHLRALERACGCSLLLRGAGGVELTEPGRALLSRADAIASELHMAQEELADLRHLRRGRVRLAAYPSAAATLVPAALARLRHDHPAIAVELTEAEPPEAVALLGSGDVDVALVFGYADRPDTPAGTRWYRLGQEPVLLVLPPEHRLAPAGSVRLAQLAGDDWIVGCDRCRAHTLDRCAEAGFAPTVRHVSDDYVVVQRLVAAGLGVTLLPESALTAYRHPGLVTVPGFGVRTFGVLHRDGAAAVPATASLLHQLDLASGLA